ncbi:hypothetical protein GC197_02010 [bacterium]|nr:hypothetical protein [bacterium]
MNEMTQDPNELRLSRFGLTWFLAMIVLIPIAMLTFLVISLPKKSDKPLPISIHIETIGDQLALVVQNQSDEQLRNIGITLNDAFHHYSKNPLPGHERMTIALGAFMRKVGINFNPESDQLTEIGIYAKLPDNSRGVFEQTSDTLLTDLQAKSSPEEKVHTSPES